ncbi:hypothetical protein BDB01DRAFT_463186 [Pilobolus umbonatus]|nr:hypothetical protein BDB01DRAFT_463186 [Pilobolus umbonatus]
MMPYYAVLFINCYICKNLSNEYTHQALDRFTDMIEVNKSNMILLYAVYYFKLLYEHESIKQVLPSINKSV